MASPKIDRKRIALLHIAKAQIGLSEEDYRAMLGSFGVESSKDLTMNQFSRVMDRMKAGGFEATPPTRENTPLGPPSRGERSAGTTIPSVETQKRRMIVKMDSVLAELGLTWAYADGMSRKMLGVEKVQWCEAGQLHKVLQALMIYRNRVRKRAISEKQAGGSS